MGTSSGRRAEILASPAKEAQLSNYFLSNRRIVPRFIPAPREGLSFSRYSGSSCCSPRPARPIALILLLCPYALPPCGQSKRSQITGYRGKRRSRPEFCPPIGSLSLPVALLAHAPLYLAGPLAWRHRIPKHYREGGPTGRIKGAAWIQ